MLNNLSCFYQRAVKDVEDQYNVFFYHECYFSVVSGQLDRTSIAVALSSANNPLNWIAWSCNAADQNHFHSPLLQPLEWARDQGRPSAVIPPPGPHDWF